MVDPRAPLTDAQREAYLRTVYRAAAYIRTEILCLDIPGVRGGAELVARAYDERYQRGGDGVLWIGGACEFRIRTKLDCVSDIPIARRGAWCEAVRAGHVRVAAELFEGRRVVWADVALADYPSRAWGRHGGAAPDPKGVRP